MHKRYLVLVGALLLAATAPAKDVATVDGQAISEEALRRSAEAMGPRAEAVLANPTLRRQLLDRMIEARLLAKAAEAAGVPASKEFQERLEEARTQLLARMHVESFVLEHTKEADVKAFFAKDPQPFGSREIHAAHVLVPDEETARKALAAAKLPGADFEALAKRYNTGPSGPKGGDLGWFRRGRMVPEFEAVAFKTPKGGVHPQPIKTQFGWHVIKVLDERGTDKAKLADVKPAVKEALERQVREDLMKSLRDRAKVAVDEGALRDMKLR